MSSITIDLDQGLAWSERLAQFRVELEQISAYIKEEDNRSIECALKKDKRMHEQNESVDVVDQLVFHTLNEDSQADEPVQARVFFQNRPVMMFKRARMVEHPSSVALRPKARGAIKELHHLSEQVEQQLKHGKIDKDQLVKLNKKLGEFQINYGHIAAVAVTISAMISGLNDLIELIQKLQP
ncbi:hypothetical protein [Laceyella tengchongensis]|nr:hypothetical protein [Laceyella tengchongensis]